MGGRDERVRSGAPSEARYGFCRARVVGRPHRGGAHRTGAADEVGRAHAALFGQAEPVATMVVVAALLDPAWKVELEVEAVRPT